MPAVRVVAGGGVAWVVDVLELGVSFVTLQ
jgi:hypothetical protein